ncbi:hypothetical protein B0H34DRAFT_677700 [Crassisporium funariophilum]|nr:hypothetical protein B0H34DRAFT_677700 [Crassisporium funariophilum]
MSPGPSVRGGQHWFVLCMGFVVVLGPCQVQQWYTPFASNGTLGGLWGGFFNFIFILQEYPKLSPKTPWGIEFLPDLAKHIREGAVLRLKTCTAMGNVYSRSNMWFWDADFSLLMRNLLALKGVQELQAADAFSCINSGNLCSLYGHLLNGGCTWSSHQQYKSGLGLSKAWWCLFHHERCLSHWLNQFQLGAFGAVVVAGQCLAAGPPTELLQALIGPVSAVAPAKVFCGRSGPGHASLDGPSGSENHLGASSAEMAATAWLKS